MDLSLEYTLLLKFQSAISTCIVPHSRTQLSTYFGVFVTACFGNFVHIDRSINWSLIWHALYLYLYIIIYTLKREIDGSVIHLPSLHSIQWLTSIFGKSNYSGICLNSECVETMFGENKHYLWCNVTWGHSKTFFFLYWNIGYQWLKCNG